MLRRSGAVVIKEGAGGTAASRAKERVTAGQASDKRHGGEITVQKLSMEGPQYQIS